MPIKQAEVDRFMSEVIQCYHCKQCATLRQEKISTYCQGCNQFFCCYIGGRCTECNGAYCRSCVLNTNYIIDKKLNYTLKCSDC